LAVLSVLGCGRSELNGTDVNASQHPSVPTSSAGSTSAIAGSGGLGGALGAGAMGGAAASTAGNINAVGGMSAVGGFNAIGGSNGGTPAAAGTGGLVGIAGTAGGAGTAGSSSCSNGGLLCGLGVDAHCIYPDSDSANCGACGHACSAGTSCAAGVCAGPLAVCDEPHFRLESLPVGVLGARPEQVLIGDWNSDGKGDLVTVNGESNGIGVLLGNGDGTFQTRVDYLDTRVFSLVSGDWNSDGHLDFAVTCDDPGTVRVLFGNGAGAFVDSGATYVTGSGYQAIAVADFNQDGNSDLVTASPDAAVISVLRGNGNGNFESPKQIPAGNEPRSIVAGDFNGDGKPDLAGVGIGPSTLTVLLGNGDCTFGAPSFELDFPWSYLSSLRAADWNNDGKLDLAALSSWMHPEDLKLFYGKGDGSFAPAEQGPSLVGWYDTADFDGDGRLDLAGMSYGASHLDVVLGKPGGGFTAGSSNTVIEDAPFAVGDLNCDGKPDLAVSGGSVGTISVMFSKGDGTFTGMRSVDSNSGPLLLEDLNGDNWLDLVAADRSTRQLKISQGSSGGQFNPFASYVLSDTPENFDAGDVNGDGRVDLIVATSGSIAPFTLLLAQNDGRYSQQAYSAGYGAQLVRLGDVNGDGRLDVAQAATGQTSVTVDYAGPGGTVASSSDLDLSTSLRWLALEDLNGDGALDLFGMDSNASVRLGNGDGSFALAQSTELPWQNPFRALADLNHDGRLDLVAGSVNYDDVFVFLGKADGSFERRVAYNLGGLPGNARATAFGDMDNDGNLDLVYSTLDTLTVLLGIGDGTFSCKLVFPASGVSSFALGDVDHDGRLDVVTANSVVSVFTNTAYASPSCVSCPCP